MMTQHTFHFPEGINVGEPEVFVVVDIQNQFRRMERNEAGQAIKMIMRNVMLERIT